MLLYFKRKEKQSLAFDLWSVVNVGELFCGLAGCCYWADFYLWFSSPTWGCMRRKEE